MKEPELLCKTCIPIKNKKDDELAIACSDCKGDHPHINAQIHQDQFTIKCPYCKNLHVHNDIGTHTCREYLYTIAPYKINALDYGEYSSFLCPFCLQTHKYDILPKDVFQPECGSGILKVTKVEDKTYHSARRIATSRLEAI